MLNDRLKPGRLFPIEKPGNFSLVFRVMPANGRIPPRLSISTERRLLPVSGARLRSRPDRNLLEQYVMSAQERKSAKNYIGLLCEATEEPITPESLPRSDRLMKNFFRDTILALLNRSRTTS